MDSENFAVSWWKNRRRIFYIALVSIALVTPVLSWLWYDNNFPLPQWRPKTGDPFARSQFPGYERLLPIQKSLLHWKFGRLTSKLNLTGSTWEDELSGATIEFRADGQIIWKKLPPAPKPGIDPITSPEDLEFVRSTDQKRYRFLPKNGGGLIWNESEKTRNWMRANLEFPGKPWQGFIGYDGNRLGLHLEDGDADWKLAKSYTIFFTRRLDH